MEAKIVSRIAKRVAAGYEEDQEGNVWQVWSIDCWGNEEDGWDFNDRSSAWKFECGSEDEKEIQKCFEQSLRDHGCRVIKFEYDWYGENDFQVNDGKTGEYLWQVNKELSFY